MFIKTVRLGKIRLFSMLALSLALIAALVALIPTYPAVAVFNSDGAKVYTGVKTNNDRIKFLQHFGWEVSSEPTETVNITIPESFDDIFTGYNELQKNQGLDLTRYKGKSVTRYTYSVTNYTEHEGDVFATLLVYKGRVIGGDICSAAPNGFIHGFNGSTLNDTPQ